MRLDEMRPIRRDDKGAVWPANAGASPNAEKKRALQNQPNGVNRNVVVQGIGNGGVLAENYLKWLAWGRKILDVGGLRHKNFPF